VVEGLIFLSADQKFSQFQAKNSKLQKVSLQHGLSGLARATEYGVGIFFPPIFMSTAVETSPAEKTLFQKKYDMEERTLAFAHAVRAFVRKLPRSTVNNEDVLQLIHSSGAIGIAYIEANETLDKKEFSYCIRGVVRQAKEAHFWLSLIDVGGSDKLKAERERLTEEAFAFVRIFCSILGKVGKKKKVEPSEK